MERIHPAENKQRFASRVLGAATAEAVAVTALALFKPELTLLALATWVLSGTAAINWWVRESEIRNRQSVG